MDKELKELKDRKELKVHKELDHHQLEAKGLKDNQDYLEDQDLQVPKALKELQVLQQHLVILIMDGVEVTQWMLVQEQLFLLRYTPQ